MPPPTRRRPIERPPSKIAGVVYIFVGILALFMAAFVMLYEGTVIGPVSGFRKGFGIVIGLYGVFRIVTGIIMARRAGSLKNPIILNDHSSEPKPPVV